MMGSGNVVIFGRVSRKERGEIRKEERKEGLSIICNLLTTLRSLCNSLRS
jgi:hypothetical protein